MRVTPQANITDGTGTTIPVKSAAEARKVLARTARLQGGTITVKQHGYDPADATAGATLAVQINGKVDDHDGTGPGPRWDVGYHSWVIDVEHEGSYNVPGLPTALGDAQMLANRLDRPVIVHVEDIKPDTGNNPHILIDPQGPVEPDPIGADTDSGAAEMEPVQKDPDRPHPDLGGTNHASAEQDEPEPQPEPVYPDVAHHEPHEDEPEPELAVMLPEFFEGTGTGPGEPGTRAGDLLAGVAVVGDRNEEASKQSTAPAKRGRRVVLLACLAAVVLLAGAAATTVLAAGTPAPSSSAATPVQVLWEARTAPGDAVVAAHGVLVNASAGKADVFSLADGKPLGGGVLPGGRARVVSGTDAVFAVVTGTDGTSTGFAATAAGVKDFNGIKGTLVARGAEPFFLTGSGKDQGAMVWDGTVWKAVPAPEPGMAPVAASKAGVLWLGANARLVSGKESASLAAPETGAKIAAWVWADEKSVAVLWDTPKGRVLAVHTIADGKITGQVPALDGDVRKAGELLVSGTKTFTIDSGAPVAAEDCTDPVPAGGRLWCRSDNTWAAKNARPLAPGQTPVPSPADVIVTATDKGFTAYAGDAMKTDQTHEEK